MSATLNERRTIACPRCGSAVRIPLFRRHRRDLPVQVVRTGFQDGLQGRRRAERYGPGAESVHRPAAGLSARSLFAVARLGADRAAVALLRVPPAQALHVVPGPAAHAPKYGRRAACGIAFSGYSARSPFREERRGAISKTFHTFAVKRTTPDETFQIPDNLRRCMDRLSRSARPASDQAPAGRPNRREPNALRLSGPFPRQFLRQWIPRFHGEGN